MIAEKVRFELVNRKNKTEIIGLLDYLKFDNRSIREFIKNSSDSFFIDYLDLFKAGVYNPLDRISILFNSSMMTSEWGSELLMFDQVLPESDDYLIGPVSVCFHNILKIFPDSDWFSGKDYVECKRMILIPGVSYLLYSAKDDIFFIHLFNDKTDYVIANRFLTADTLINYRKEDMTMKNQMLASVQLAIRRGYFRSLSLEKLSEKEWTVM